MPSRTATLDHVPSGMLSGRIAAGIAASTRVSAAPLQRHPLPDMDGLAQLLASGRLTPLAAVDRSVSGEGPDPVAIDPWLRAEMQQRMEHHRRALLPDYEHRLQVDGKAAADAWLQREAVERGHREAVALRGLGERH